MKTIHKKILSQYMDEVIRGKKTFEIRKDEDDIQVGDIIVLEEWSDGKYKNVSVNAEVTYVLRNCPEHGLMDGYCVIGLACNWNNIYNQGREDVVKEMMDYFDKKAICVKGECINFDTDFSCIRCVWEQMNRRSNESEGS